MTRWSCCALLLSLFAPTSASAEDGYFYMFVSNGPTDQVLVESAWREAQGVGTLTGADEAKRRISRVYPRFFGTTRPGDKAAIEADLKAAKAAYFATDFELAEQHFGRAIEALYDSPEVLASSAVMVSRLADSAALRYTNTLARQKPPAAAQEELRGFISRFPMLAPTQTEHAPDVLSAYVQAKKAVEASSGTLQINVLPLELDRSGTCRLQLNGVELAPLPMSAAVMVPRGDHYVQVKCAQQVSWLQRVTVTSGMLTVTMPVRAMIATRADTTSGGFVMVSPTEGDSQALVAAVSKYAGFLGAFTVRPTQSQKVSFDRWSSGQDAPTTVARGDIKDAKVTNVTTRVELPPQGGDDGLSPWPFVVGGVGVAALIGGAVANMDYLDQRDAGAQDLDATPAAVLYGVGGALVLTGVILFIVDVTGDDEGTASVEPGSGGGVLVRF